jgi:hypothetical protein
MYSRYTPMQCLHQNKSLINHFTNFRILIKSQDNLSHQSNCQSTLSVPSLEQLHQLHKPHTQHSLFRKHGGFLGRVFQKERNKKTNDGVSIGTLGTFQNGILENIL